MVITMPKRINSMKIIMNADIQIINIFVINNLLKLL